jgi:hypothetical protein
MGCITHFSKGTTMRSWLRTVALAALLGAGSMGTLGAQDTRDEQFYYPGSFNWQFLKRYNNAARLFNAFDYGHAVLYEKLLTKPDALREELEDRQFTYLTTNLLVRPPRFAVAEEAIEPSYAKLAWRGKMMFDWAHILHRQVYDVYADPRLSTADKDRLIEKLTDYYLTNPHAFVPVPKSMTLMDDQYYSQVFRKGYPKMNGLIWAYHWLQVGLYEPLIEGRTPADRKAGLEAAVARFWSMVQDPPRNMPKVMPMTSTVAPRFSEAHPRAAVIFDNLHMTHDIISDILAADTVPADRKRDVIYAALDEMQDSTRNVMSMDDWRNMGEMMGGIAAMGGPATGIVPIPPSRDVPVDAMAGMREHAMGHGVPAPDGAARAALGAAQDTAAMPDAHHGMRQGAMRDSMAGMRPKAAARETAPPQRQPSHQTTTQQADSAHGAMAAHMDQMMKLHLRMMADPVIRKRMMADTGMRRMATEMMDEMPAEHRGHLRQLSPKAAADTSAVTQPVPPRGAKRAGPRKPDKPATKPRDPHAATIWAHAGRAQRSRPARIPCPQWTTTRCQRCARPSAARERLMESATPLSLTAG